MAQRRQFKSIERQLLTNEVLLEKDTFQFLQRSEKSVLKKFDKLFTPSYLNTLRSKTKSTKKSIVDRIDVSEIHCASVIYSFSIPHIAKEFLKAEDKLSVIASIDTDLFREDLDKAFSDICKVIFPFFIRPIRRILNLITQLT